MVLSRSAALRGSIRSFTLRRAGTQARANLRLSVGRRTFASAHEAKKSSDIPWLIGSVAATVPAAAWLWQQGPSASDHGHGHESHGKEEETHEEESEEKEEASDDDDKESKDDSSDDSKDESKDEESDAPKSEPASDEDTTSAPPKDAKVSEKKGEKDAKSDTSGAKNPLIDSEKSRKPEGPVATAKIHGTVDSTRPTKGKKGDGDDDDDSKEDGNSDD